MRYIKELSEDLIKKIAAGEVIERPASVVKELVENSIDASSKRIDIEVSRNGKHLKIQDDGIGIHSIDIPLLFTRHATSKLNSFDDLWEISTLGFRGEALASVSSISKVKCSSKNKDEDCGFEIKLNDGKLEKKSSGISKGTIFEIDDLFYNVPARQKFLKSGNTEIGHIYDVVIAQALSHPEISFILKNNNNVLLSTSGSGDLIQAITEVVGNDLNGNMIFATAKNDFLSLSGYISALEVFRSNRKFIFTFVNSRPVKCSILSKAIFNAYEGLLPPNKSPIVVLNLNFKPNFVDVNVHPTKKEVRYTNTSDVYNLVLATLQNLISNHYKEVYKNSEQSLQFSDEQITGSVQGNKNLEEYKPSESYTQAAFELYSKQDGKILKLQNSQISDLQNDKTYLFSIGSLKCYTLNSTDVIANITKIGNKTIFEVGHIFENSQVVFSGEVNGPEDYQKDFFDSLSDLGDKFYKLLSNNKLPIQSKLIHKGIEDDCSRKKTGRKKPPLKTLQEIWKRDNWTCVYCSKQLLDPDVVKKAIKESENGFVTYINSEGNEITEHLLKKYAATYDHFIPFSKMPQFNQDSDNLFASCIECNCKKSDSMDLKSWKPIVTDSWSVPLEIVNLIFESPKEYKIKASKK